MAARELNEVAGEQQEEENVEVGSICVSFIKPGCEPVTVCEFDKELSSAGLPLITLPSDSSLNTAVDAYRRELWDPLDVLIYHTPAPFMKRAMEWAADSNGTVELLDTGLCVRECLDGERGIGGSVRPSRDVVLQTLSRLVPGLEQWRVVVGDQQPHNAYQPHNACRVPLSTFAALRLDEQP